MKYEFHAAYPFALQDSVTQAFAIDWLVSKSDRLPHSWREIIDIADSFQRIMLLSQALLTPYKDQARMGTRKEAGGMRFWLKKEAPGLLATQITYMKRMDLLPTLPDLALFPHGSWAIQVHFTLRKPYLSQDDVDFYILDNPVKKEWVFKVPYVAPSQWKGALRSAMMHDLVSGLHSGRVDETGFVQERLRLYRLFGNEKDGTAEFLNRAWALRRVEPRPEDDRRAREWEEKFKRTCEQVEREFEDRLRDEGYRVGDVEGFRGRLHFYPTFFDRIGLEVINPHPRDTGAGKNPLYFECVPAGTSGIFTLLYVPLDAGPKDEATADFKAVARGVRAMLTQYGFGAKTSSGYGVADILKDKSQVVPPDLEKVFWKAWEENNA